MSFIAKNPLSIPEIENSPPPPAEGTRGLFAKEDGWYDIDENGNEKLLTSSAQSASYIICAEDSVNKEGATVIVKRESPFAATDADGNLLYDENGNQILTNNLQIAFDEIFNRGDFKYGSEIVVRRGTYINESLKSYYHLYINKPCTVRFEDTHFYQLGVIHLEAYSNNYRGAGWIHLIGAYCNEIDISSAQNIVESCYANSIIVSSRLNTVINNLTSNIYLTGIDEEIYAKQCRFWGNTSIVRSTKSTYTQADGFVDTEGDIYQVNDIEGTEYIKSLTPIKSISANGTPLEPDENKNVDIPLATTKTEWGPVYDEEWGEEIYTQKEVAGDAGLMSGEEKLKLKQIEEKAQINKIEKIKLGDVETVIKDKTVAIPYTSKTMWEIVAPEVEDPYDYLGGLMTGEQHKKLAYIENGAQANKIESMSINGVVIEPDENKNVDIPLSNSEQDGLISAEDKVKLDNIADGAQVNVQSDWNQTDDTKDDYIKNKPNNLATETYVNEKIAAMVDSAPETLDTLNELAQALGDDPNFATTVATQIGQKVDKEEGKGLSSNDFTDDYQSKVDTAVQSISANGKQLTPDENKNVDISINAQSATYVICAEDSVNKEGATAIVKQAYPFDATDAEGNPIYDENGNQVITNNLQVVFDEIFNRDDFKPGSEIIVRRGTYMPSGIPESLRLNLKIKKPCSVVFEDVRHNAKFGTITLDGGDNTAYHRGQIRLKNAYCNYIDICSTSNIVEDCIVMSTSDTGESKSGSIVISANGNVVRNCIVGNIYFSGMADESRYAYNCKLEGNMASWANRHQLPNYIQATGYLGEDIYTENDIECTAYIRSLIPVKSISANDVPLEPDENENVDIPMVNGYNPGLVRVVGSGWGIQFSQMNVGNTKYDGCLATEPATQDDIDKRQNSHKPITPATLKYAVESITNPVTLGTNEVIEDNSITINLLNNKKYILTQDTTYSNMTIEYTFDSSDPSIALNGFYEFNAGLIFKTPSDIDCNFIYPSSFYFISDDAEDGVFAPQKNMVYEIMFSVEAKTGEKPYYIARVSGYELPTNEVS